MPCLCALALLEKRLGTLKQEDREEEGKEEQLEEEEPGGGRDHAPVKQVQEQDLVRGGEEPEQCEVEEALTSQEEVEEQMRA